MDILISVRCWNARTQHAVHGSGIQEGSLLGEYGVLHCSTLSLPRTPQKLHSEAEIVSHAASPWETERDSICVLQQIQSVAHCKMQLCSAAQLLVHVNLPLQAYFMLDEMLLAGEMQEPSKKASAYRFQTTCYDHFLCCPCRSCWVHAGHHKGDRGAGPARGAGKGWWPSSTWFEVAAIR